MGEGQMEWGEMRVKLENTKVLQHRSIFFNIHTITQQAWYNWISQLYLFKEWFN